MFKLLGSFLGGWKAALLIGVLIAGILTAAVGYFHYSQNQIRTLSRDLAQVTTELADTKVAYAAQREDAIRTQKLNDLLSSRLSEVRDRAQKAKVVIQKHDLGRIAEKHPSALEARINRATAASLRRLEELSRVR